MSVEALTAFFDLILPATGWKCLFTLPDKRHFWFRDHAHMAVMALRLDAEGKTVYHGNASFKSKRRKAENVEAKKAFHLDIDAGSGKPYADPRSALVAFENWRRATALPASYVVASGGGIHAYWPLRDAVGAAQWLSAAHHLRVLTQNLSTDTTVTCDAARILRPPGTHNRKNGTPVPVKAGLLVGPYGVEDLKPLFEGVENGVGLRVLLQHQPLIGDMRGVLAPPESKNDGLTNIYAVEPDPDPDLIAQECAQVRRLRDTGGKIPEPEWYAVLGVLSHCGESGSRAAHQWSSGDPRYVASATEVKLAHAREAAGPTTCRRFAEFRPEICLACPHHGRITSPIQLGRPLPVTLTAPAPPKLELPVLPDPYHWRGTRLAVRDQSGKEAAPPYHIITEYPFAISELQEGERSGGVSAICRSWEPMRAEWREFPLLLKDLLGDRGSSSLAHYGVAIHKRAWDHMRSFVTSMTNFYRGTRVYGVRYEQYGWKKQGFVIGNEYISLGSVQRVFGSPEVERRFRDLSAQGSLSAWQAAVEKTTLRPGAEAHTFVGLCGFASILYHLTGSEGGTIVHATTLESGKGKTFGLRIAASVWGAMAGLRLKERDTEIAKFITLGVLCHLPVVYDELRANGADATDRIKSFVLHYTMGEDKARGAPEGGLKDAALPWSNILLSTANLSLIDTCLSDGAETAQAARVFEFVPTLPEDVTTSEGDELEREMEANRGVAGRLFAVEVLKRWDWVKTAVPRAVKMWEQRLKVGPELRYTVRLLGVVTVAMAIIQESGILKLDAAAVTRWMETAARENAARLGLAREVDPVGILSRMINDMQPNTLVMPNPVPRGTMPFATTQPPRSPTGPLLLRYEINGGEVLIADYAVKEWMQKHKYPFTELGKALLVLGVVKSLRIRRTLSAGWRRTGQDWCWQIDGTHHAIAEVLLENAPVVVENNVVEFPSAHR